MERRAQRAWIVTAIIMGTTFSWLPPCLVAVAIEKPLPQIVFLTWSAFVGVGSLLLLLTLMDRWQS